MEDIVTHVGGEPLHLVGVASTPDLRMSGGGQMSAFFYVVEGGLVKLRLIPVVANAFAKAYEITLLAPPVEP